MGNIDWVEISEMPEEFKDGRRLLLHYWVGRRGPVICEGFWNEKAGLFMALHEPVPRVTHFAEINPPGEQDPGIPMYGMRTEK